LRARYQPAGLSERHQRILDLLIAGHSHAEISTRTGDQRFTRHAPQ
jgi:hypothetical protein